MVEVDKGRKVKDQGNNMEVRKVDEREHMGKKFGLGIQLLTFITDQCS